MSKRSPSIERYYIDIKCLIYMLQTRNKQAIFSLDEIVETIIKLTIVKMVITSP